MILYKNIIIINNIMEYEYNGMSYYIEKSKGESDDMFFNRSWFIIKQEPTSIEEFNILLKKSEIWVKHKYLGCLYEENIQNEINKLDKNISCTK